MTDLYKQYAQVINEYDLAESNELRDAAIWRLMAIDSQIAAERKLLGMKTREEQEVLTYGEWNLLAGSSRSRGTDR